MHRGRRIQLKTQDLDLVSIRYSIKMNSLSHPAFISIDLISNESEKNGSGLWNTNTRRSWKPVIC